MHITALHTLPDTHHMKARTSSAPLQVLALQLVYPYKTKFSSGSASIIPVPCMFLQKERTNQYISNHSPLVNGCMDFTRVPD